MESPIEQFIEWYKSLPISHRQDIVTLISYSCPGFENVDIISTDIEELPDSFIKTVQTYQNSKFKEVGVILALRSIIQLMFIDKRSEDIDRWNDVEGMLGSLAKTNESETFKKLEREVPFNAKEWIVSCDKWNTLITNNISDQKLNLFLNT
jgi:hypothetical protein